MPALDPTPARRVLILGGGFGGTYAALELEKVLARQGNGSLEVTLVTRDNFFLFTPMLHEVAASDLELSTIVNPLRKLYLSKLPRLEKKLRVALDWILDLCFAKDFACLTDGRAVRP